MLSALRRAWERYLASIPAPEEPDLIPDSKILREDFMRPPVNPESRLVLAQLSKELTAHLPSDVASREMRRLSALLKPGVEPVEAVVRWFGKVTAPDSKVGGFVLVDWKAREEVEWQAARLVKSHKLPLVWSYAIDTDNEWKDWRERGEAPVDTPLMLLAVALQNHGYTLFKFGSDDLVCAFAVDGAISDQVRSLCEAIHIELKP